MKKNLFKDIKWLFSNRAELKSTLKSNWGLLLGPIAIILLKSWVVGLILVIVANLSNFMYSFVCKVFTSTVKTMQTDLQEQHQRYMRLASTVFGAKVTKSNLNN